MNKLLLSNSFFTQHTVAWNDISYECQTLSLYRWSKLFDISPQCSVHLQGHFINQNASTLSFLRTAVTTRACSRAESLWLLLHIKTSQGFRNKNLIESKPQSDVYPLHLWQLSTAMYIYISKYHYFKTSTAASSITKTHFPSPPEISDLTVEVSGAPKVRCLICQSWPWKTQLFCHLSLLPLDLFLRHVHALRTKEHGKK